MTEISGLLHEAMKQSASTFPEEFAFKVPGKSLTYAALERKSNQLSNVLIKEGIEKGDRIGILMHRCIETSYAIYGILQAGGVYVPLDPKAPLKRLAFQVENCNIKVILTLSQQRRSYTKLTCKSIEISDDLLDQEDNNFVGVDLTGDDNAYILYTSGSTGLPKGILHTHKSGFSFAKLCQLTFGIKETDIIANHAPIFFDISTLAYFAGPLCGACTLIIPDAHTIMAASMLDLISKENITIWYSVPLALIQMHDTGKLVSEALESLRIVFYAGEPFHPRQLRLLMESLPNRKIINVYGPTETNICTFHEIIKLPEVEDRIPIGKTWAQTDYKIVDEELLIKSVTNMKAYWAKPKLTERAFVEIDGDTYYKTGDLVEEIDQLLYLKGRRDHQIKFRGFRIELGDIEHAFKKHLAVKEAVALLLQNQEGQDEIVCVLKIVGEAEEKEVGNFVKDILPKYAVPTKIIMLDEFPRTSTGKVQRSEIMKLVT